MQATPTGVNKSKHDLLALYNNNESELKLLEL